MNLLHIPARATTHEMRRKSITPQMLNMLRMRTPSIQPNLTLNESSGGAARSIGFSQSTTKKGGNNSTGYLTCQIEGLKTHLIFDVRLMQLVQRRPVGRRQTEDVTVVVDARHHFSGQPSQTLFAHADAVLQRGHGTAPPLHPNNTSSRRLQLHFFSQWFSVQCRNNNHYYHFASLFYFIFFLQISIQ